MLLKKFTKKLLKAGKEKKFVVINKWITAIQYIHIYEDPLFSVCSHQRFDQKRKWIKNGKQENTSKYYRTATYGGNRACPTNTT